MCSSGQDVIEGPFQEMGRCLHNGMVPNRWRHFSGEPQTCNPRDVIYYMLANATELCRGAKKTIIRISLTSFHVFHGGVTYQDEPRCSAQARALVLWNSAFEQPHRHLVPAACYHRLQRGFCMSCS